MTPVVRALLIVTIGVTILEWLLPIPWYTLGMVPLLLPQYPWTIITYMFVHGGVFHLLFNMIVLFFFGPRLEVRLGSRHFLVLYLLSGIFGALLSIVTSPAVGIIGASGATFGVLFGFARYWPTERIMIWGILPIEARLLVIILAVISIVFGLGRPGFGGIAHLAHLGGFVGAFLYLKVLELTAPSRRFRKQATWVRPSSGTSSDMERWSSIRREGLHEINLREIDRLLEKARTHGAGSLTPDERAYLDRMSA